MSLITVGEGKMPGKKDFTLIHAIHTRQNTAPVGVPDLLLFISYEWGTVFNMSPHSGKERPRTHDMQEHAPGLKGLQLTTHFDQ